MEEAEQLCLKQQTVCVVFQVNLAEKSALVYYKTAVLGPQDICDFIEDMGFEASVAGKTTGTSIHVCCIHVDGMTCNSCVQTIEGK